MIYGSISRRYAKALFEIGEEKGNLQAIADGLESFTSLWNKSDELRAALTDPSVTLSTKQSIVEKASSHLGLVEPLRKFLLLLLKKKRIAAVQYITLTLRSMCDRKEGILRGEIISAFEIEWSQLEQIRSRLESRLGGRVIIEKRTDPALLGGAILKIGDLVVDGSIRSTLEDLKKRMTSEL